MADFSGVLGVSGLIESAVVLPGMAAAVLIPAVVHSARARRQRRMLRETRRGAVAALTSQPRSGWRISGRALLSWTHGLAVSPATVREQLGQPCDVADPISPQIWAAGGPLP